MRDDYFTGSGEDFAFNPPPREALARIKRRKNGNLIIEGVEHTAELKFETRVWRRYIEWMREAGVSPELVP